MQNALSFFVPNCLDDASGHDNKKELQKFKGLHDQILVTCARDVHNLTKKARVRQWGECPSSFLPSHHFFLPPSHILDHSFSLSAYVRCRGL